MVTDPAICSGVVKMPFAPELALAGARLLQVSTGARAVLDVVEISHDVVTFAGVTAVATTPGRPRQQR